MSIVLIRHGRTAGNLEHRYIGSRTDEPLCPQGEAELGRGPNVQRVFSSPMRRCIKTAEILFPGVPIETAEGLRECDFGAFEGKNYRELSGRPDYQAWIDSGGEAAFPGGECRKDFAARCVQAFEAFCPWDEDAAFVVHGGTIMAIMEKYARPQGSYFDFQVKNGEGYVLEKSGAYRKISVYKA